MQSRSPSRAGNASRAVHMLATAFAAFCEIQRPPAPMAPFSCQSPDRQRNSRNLHERPPASPQITEHHAHTIYCARLHPEEMKMAELLEHGLSFTEQKPSGSCQLGKRAVVIGAGIGGLATSGALAQYFEQVDILERDRLGGAAGVRPRPAPGRQ